MSATMEKLSSNQVKLTVTVSAEEFDKAMNTAYGKLKGRLSVPGFRKGKAPRKVIENYYGAGVLVEEAFNTVLPESYDKAVEETGAKPVAQPEIDIESIGAGEDCVYTATVYVRPEVTLGQYKGVAAPAAKWEVTEDQINAEIDRAAERVSRMAEVTDRAAQMGDTANINYAGSVDGVAFEGGTAENTPLELGSGMFIPGFEEQMVGMNIGEERDLNVKFPEQYHAENLAGKDAVFHVKVNGIQTKVRPVLDDDFAADVSEFDTFEAYKANIVADLEKNAADRAEANLEDALIQKVVDAADCDIPEAMIDDEVKTMLREMEMRMMYQGIRFEDYLKYTGQTIEQVSENYKPEAANRVKTQLVLEAVAKAENIAPTDEDVDETIADQAKRMNRDVEEFKASLSEQQKEYLKETAGIKKVIDFLKANAVITEKAAEEKAE